jgi:hypothetical protein
MELTDATNAETYMNEVERIIKEFRKKFHAETSDSENFISMNEIERMWSDLRKSTDDIYTEMSLQFDQFLI